ncbi:hypothetical protein [Dyadobacter psychrotolerans]|uniref:META domain-containing protein n=1 Tax=Dyadobacter psychrotolerans TaxID=2541721 RepID=A0A4R5DI91_9BACT|nr:hypothetical protein [Dyadobacter psychrotolerans]TDE13822.1 hypothetical protein E0F88_18195 [Dyadobacter psychrotolerans]
MKSLLVIFIVLLISAFQCGKEVDCCVMPPCSDSPTLEGSWKLTGYRDISTGNLEIDPDLNAKGVVFTFKDDEKTGNIEGHTSVNTVSGSYELMEYCRLKVTSFGGTKVGEPAWSNRAWLASDSTFGYERIGNNLTIYRNTGKEGMVFRKQ